jgi:hypothetical protein
VLINTAGMILSETAKATFREQFIEHLKKDPDFKKHFNVQPGA